MKFFKLLALLGIFCFSIANVSAQSDRSKVKMSAFDYSRQAAKDVYVTMIYDHISTKVGKYPKVILIRDDGRKAADKEHDEIMSESFSNSELVEQGRYAGAEQIVFGRVYTTQVIRESYESYSVKLRLYLAIIDVESGSTIDEVILSPHGRESIDKMREITRKWNRIPQMLRKRFKPEKILAWFEAYDLAKTISGTDENDSFQKALDQMDKGLVPFLDYHFAGKVDGGYQPEAKITTQDNNVSAPAPENYVIEMIEDNKLILPSGGLKKGMKMVALQLKTLSSGKVREIKIADLIVEEMQGDVAVVKPKGKKVKAEDMDKPDIVIRIADKQGLNGIMKK